MKISVVIPVYNEEKYLPKTLASLEKLDRKPDEVIIVDAASTDHTVSLAKKWGARVLEVEHKTIAYSRQKGLEAAKGDIVACTDADDIVPPHWLTTIERAFTKPDVVATYGIYHLYDGPWAYRFFINICSPFLVFLASRFGVHFAAGQNMAFLKKSALAVGGFPVDFRTAEDMKLIQRLQDVGKVVYLPHGTVSTSGRRGKEGFAFIFRVLRELFGYFTKGKPRDFGFPDIR
jgi:glycosyltransferase involved in cell wall biosynthesis